MKSWNFCNPVIANVFKRRRKTQKYFMYQKIKKNGKLGTILA